MNKLDGKSLDIVSQNIEKIKELFPEVFSEGKINFAKLKEELGKVADDEAERYNFTWSGKSEAKRIAQTPSTGTLRPCKEESKDWDTTQNLYIEGDNLEVLKLLQKSYHKQVKMIYIDPPYNTGKDFVYKDNFKDNIKNYLEITGQVDSEGNRLSTNSDTNGRYHSDWLNMMYPRLKLARNLLKDDGVIFISIDDNEVANLRKLCDEIFGEDNFIGNICHKARASVSNDKIISSNHNHILLYAKNGNIIFENRKYFGLNPNLNGFDKEDEKGKYKYTPVDGPGGARKGNPYYTFEGVTGFFRYSEETMRDKFNKGLIVKVGESLQQKYYLEDAKNTRKTDTTWWDEKLYTSTATIRLKDLMDGDYFTNPKHVELLIRILTLSTTKDDLILDFFSGSATTAHAVMKLNSEDGDNRKYICVQLPEETDEKSEAYKAGYKNICEIGKERIRRAGEKVKEEWIATKSATSRNDGLLSSLNDSKAVQTLDIGFKVLKLDSSNIKTWDSNTAFLKNIIDYKEKEPIDYKKYVEKLRNSDNAFNVDKMTDNEIAIKILEYYLEESINNIKSDRKAEDLLYEILLKYGLDLTLPIEEKTLHGKKVFVIGYGALIVCLDNEITLEIVEAIAKLKDEYKSEITRVVFKDSSFADAVVKTNALQVLKQFEIDEVVSV